MANIKEKLNYDLLTEKLVAESERSENSYDAVEACLSGIRKLAIAKKFSKIDAEILKVSLDSGENYNSDFFTKVINLESKRLTFKEEVNKCQTRSKLVPIKSQVKLNT